MYLRWSRKHCTNQYGFALQTSAFPAKSVFMNLYMLMRHQILLAQIVASRQLHWPFVMFKARPCCRDILIFPQLDMLFLTKVYKWKHQLGCMNGLKNKVYLFYLPLNSSHELSSAFADVCIKFIEVHSRHHWFLFDFILIARGNQGMVKPGPDICHTLFSRKLPSFNLIPVLLTSVQLFMPPVFY